MAGSCVADEKHSDNTTIKIKESSRADGPNQGGPRSVRLG